ncbi:hypothetical protein FOCC_FOCC005871 [Frankliniella occidentalis]|nr:hypothetical protein FOCC_FOCC005871 [Frankliniella occidentalis]
MVRIGRCDWCTNAPACREVSIILRTKLINLKLRRIYILICTTANIIVNFQKNLYSDLHHITS